MDPTGPAQPNIGIAYNTAGNPAEQTEQEQRSTVQHAQSNPDNIVEARERGDVPVPSGHGGLGKPSALGLGVRDDSQDIGDDKIPRGDTEGDQMRVLAEGEVADAQNSKTGFGEQKDLASDLDQKKAEQAGRREATKSAEADNVDVAGALGGRVGPAVVEGRDHGAA